MFFNVAQILWFAWFVYFWYTVTTKGDTIFLWRLLVSFNLMAECANAYQNSSIIRCNGWNSFFVCFDLELIDYQCGCERSAVYVQRFGGHFVFLFDNKSTHMGVLKFINQIQEVFRMSYISFRARFFSDKKMYLNFVVIWGYTKNSAWTRMSSSALV